MNSPEQNNYAQYVNDKGQIKVKNVVFVNNGLNTRFVVSGINEPFFILAVFQNNLKVEGVGFDDLENNLMLSFINANMVDIDAIPNGYHLPPLTVATMSYNNEYVLRDKPMSKTNEYIFFKEYLEEYFPDKKFVITPYYWQNGQLGSGMSNRNMYYCTFHGGFVGTSMRYDLPMTYNNSSNYQLFNWFVKNDGANGPYVAIQGYQATFEVDIFALPVAPPVIDK